MSIAKMDKVWIIGMKGQEESVLRNIMHEGIIQIDDTSYLADEEEFKGMLTKEENNNEVSLLNKKLSQIDIAISNIRRITKTKKSMFASKKYYQNISEEEAEKTFEKVTEINKAVDDIANIKSKQEQLKEEEKTLTPWKELKVEAEYFNTKNINIVLGTVPKNANMDELKDSIKEANVNCSIILVNQDKNLQYISAVIYDGEIDKTKRLLKKYKFVETTLLQKGSVAERLQEIQQELSNVKNEEDGKLKLIKKDLLDKFENLYDYYTMKKDIKAVEKNIVLTKNTFYIEGWMPRGRKIKQGENYIIQTKKPDEDEEYPILMENNGLVTPFESITNMYSYPNQKEIDPNPIMSFFYIIFFGMMLSDAGYGAILTIACAVIWKMKKYKKGEGNLIKLLTFCGVSTIVWGILFGGIFGNLIPITPVIDPLKDVMALMGLSLLFGIIHIYSGLFMKALALIKEKKVFSAIFDVGFWYLFLTGIFLLIIPIVAGDIGIWSTVGKYLAISGAIGLVLTQGRAEKGIFKKGFKGVSSLYDVTSYFADVLSYSRIMALCLSTGVIAQVVNLLGQIAGPIPAVFIGLIGHTINIANSALGSYVHTSRLQYVEFFGKFYEGGGKPFQPFMCKTKYTKIKEEF